jgi:hypothetical protein
MSSNSLTAAAKEKRTRPPVKKERQQLMTPSTLRDIDGKMDIAVQSIMSHMILYTTVNYRFFVEKYTNKLHIVALERNSSGLISQA